MRNTQDIRITSVLKEINGGDFDVVFEKLETLATGNSIATLNDFREEWIAQGNQINKSIFRSRLRSFIHSLRYLNSNSEDNALDTKENDSKLEAFKGELIKSFYNGESKEIFKLLDDKLNNNSYLKKNVLPLLKLSFSDLNQDYQRGLMNINDFHIRKNQESSKLLNFINMLSHEDII